MQTIDIKEGALTNNKIFDLLDHRYSKKYILYEHLHNSYNDFVLQVKNYLETNDNIFEENRQGKYIYRYRFKFEDIHIRPALNADGETLMYPMDARQKNNTYSIKFIAKKTTQIQEIYDMDEKRITTIKEVGTPVMNEVIVIMPNMVRSKYCALNINHENQMRECENDPGGYFIVNGSEKIVLCLEKMIENKPLVFMKKDVDFNIYEVKINSKSINPNIITQSVAVRMKKNKELILRVPIFAELPVFTILRILGMETDREIIKNIVYDENDMEMVDLLKESIEVSKKEGSRLIISKEQAIISITNKIRVMKKYSDNKKLQFDEKKEHLEALLRNAFLPHLNNDKYNDIYKVKAQFLCYMINKLLNCYLGRTSPDDRDSFTNKRIDMPGDLLFELFKQFYKKMLNACNKFFKKRSDPKHENPLPIINQIKPSTIELGIKSGLLIGTFGKKKGVAQLYPRVSYLQSIAFLRRIDAPGSDATTSKLVGPRHYHASQTGFCCLTGDSEILMSDGSIKLIKDIKNGDSVKTVNLSTLEILETKIKNWFVKDTDKLLELTLDNNKTIKMTTDHRLYIKTCNPFTDDYEMVEAQDIKNNEILLNYVNGKFEEIRVKGIKEIPVEPVYDFETVADTHNFIVNGVISHNCPIESPEHANIGLIKHLTMLSTITTGSIDQANMIYENIITNKNFTHIDNVSSLDLAQSTKIFVNGEWIGITQEPLKVYEDLRILKTSGLIYRTNGITHDLKTKEIRVCTDSGRLVRQVLKVENNEILLTDKIIDEILKEKTNGNVNKWELLMMKYPEVIDTIDMEEQYYNMIAVKKDDVIEMKTKEKITLEDNNEPILNRYDDNLIVKYTHCEIHPTLTVGIITANIPFANYNMCTRNMFQYAQGKQAMGIYISNYRDRLDISYLLYNTQRPIVNTKLSKYIHTDVLPCGENAVVMIGCYTGQNSDDSIIFNQSSIDRGLFRSTTFKKWDSKIEKNQSTSQDDMFMKPDISKLESIKQISYDKLNDKGYVPEETEVENNDVIIGKVTPIQRDKAGKTMKDSSLVYKSNERATIDRVFTNIQDAEGYDMIKIRTRSERIPKVGDKYCSRHGQKGTIGLTLHESDMPFTEEGIVPDLIVNANAIPSRMTIAQLLECLVGKIAAVKGCEMDATSFSAVDIEGLKDELQKLGYDRNATETMYNGMTGQKFKIPIFIGPTYYQRLKHLVSDKMHCLTSSHKVLTTTGWRHIYDISKMDKVATLNRKENKIEYHNPLEIHRYENGEKKLLYHIKNKNIDTITTEGHRMLVDGELVEVRNIIGKKKYRNMYGEFEVDHDTQVKKYYSNQNVYCLTVPNEVFYVKNKDLEYWTGNSRARGSVTMLTRQPCEGRSKDGGHKCGEMERDSIISHGMSMFLKERMMDLSDAYSTYVCDICGLFAKRQIKKNSAKYPQDTDTYHCLGCRNNKTKISKIVIPYAFKLLIQELMSMNIAPRIRTKQYFMNK